MKYKERVRNMAIELMDQKRGVILSGYCTNYRADVFRATQGNRKIPAERSTVFVKNFIGEGVGPQSFALDIIGIEAGGFVLDTVTPHITDFSKFYDVLSYLGPAKTALMMNAGNDLTSGVIYRTLETREDNAFIGRLTFDGIAKNTYFKYDNSNKGLPYLSGLTVEQMVPLAVRENAVLKYMGMPLLAEKQIGVVRGLFEFDESGLAIAKKYISSLRQDRAASLLMELPESLMIEYFRTAAKGTRAEIFQFMPNETSTMVLGRISSSGK